MFLPRGYKARYTSAEGCRLFWSIYPGNWEETTDFSINQKPGRAHPGSSALPRLRTERGEVLQARSGATFSDLGR